MLQPGTSQGSKWKEVASDGGAQPVNCFLQTVGDAREIILQKESKGHRTRMGRIDPG